MITLLIEMLIAACVFALFYYVLGLIPGLPAWARPVFVLVALIIVLLCFLQGGCAGLGIGAGHGVLR
jgi:hypothetical protein